MASSNLSSLLLGVFVLATIHSSLSITLSPNYYDQTCPNVEAAVTSAVKKAMLNDRTVPAALLRMQFHDCFIRSGGPSWVVPKGRKDGRISKATETRQLPAPTFNISQLQQSFSQRGLDISDLVALSGGHTLGFAHCSSFQNRIHNFATTQDVDPSLQQAFAASLRSVCPIHNKVNSAGANLDSTPTIFDNRYYKLLLEGESIFSSDQALLTNPTTKNLVKKYAYSREEFEKAFVESMIKMSSITGGQEELTFFAEVMNHSGTFEISSSSIDDK
nr:peroxidase 64-like [Tanacetum cinerariifolium]